MVTTKRKLVVANEQPDWVCYKCGVLHGSFKCGLATWHPDTCGVCGESASCTEPRDFGYLLVGWDKKAVEEF